MDDHLTLKIVAALVIANAVYATFAHRKNNLTIYVDWTDAAITALSPLIGFGVYLILSFFTVPAGMAKMLGGVVFVGLLFFSIRLTWRTNRSATTFLSAAVAKYTVLVTFYVGLALILSGSKREKYERRATVAKRDAASIAAAVAGYVTWSHWVSRAQTFTPIANWFAGNSFQLLGCDDELEGSPQAAE